MLSCFRIALWAFGIASAVILVLELVYAFSYTSIELAGTSATTLPISEYGFGVERRLLVINVTLMGGYTQIDESEKKLAEMWVYGSKHDPDDAPFSGEHFYIGLEFKGGGLGDRAKPNLDIELWEEDGTDEHGMPKYDDTKDKLFFSEKAEDFVLRGGYFEPSMTRDALAPRLAGVPYETVIVDVVMIQPGNVTTYEGSFVMFHKVARRMAEKYLEWENDGKKIDCEEIVPGTEEEAVSSVAIVFEWDLKYVEGKAMSKSDKMCSNYDHFLSIYPKCSFYEEQNATLYPDCVSNYSHELNRVASMLHLSAGSVVPLDLNASMYDLGRVLIAESILLDAGFASDSDLWVVAPAADGVRRINQVLYDHDEQHYRTVDPSKNGIVTIRSNWDVEEHTVWGLLASHPPFLDTIYYYGEEWLLEMNSSIHALFDERESQLEAGHFENNLKRWPLFKYETNHRLHHERTMAYLYGSRALPKKTMKEELEFGREFYTKRVDRLLEAVRNRQALGVQEYPHILSIILGHLWWQLVVWIVFLALLTLFCCGAAGPSNVAVDSKTPFSYDSAAGETFSVHMPLLPLQK